MRACRGLVSLGLLGLVAGTGSVKTSAVAQKKGEKVPSYYGRSRRRRTST